MLASRSPQRRALLASLGVDFRVVVADVAEGSDAAANARAKAHAVLERVGIPTGGGVLGADTEVILDTRALGKPRDERDAARMLAALSGRPHVVVTALSLVSERGTSEIEAEATVRFRDLSDGLRDWYLARGEWRDRAGAYAIQGAGAALVEGIEGEPSTVIGLPVGTLGQLLAGTDLAPWR